MAKCKFRKGDRVYWRGVGDVKHPETVQKTQYGRVYFEGGGYCYEADLYSDIIPKKPKTKSVRAWACVSDMNNPFTSGFRVEFKRRRPNYVTPCTITYTERGHETRK